MREALKMTRHRLGLERLRRWRNRRSVGRLPQGDKPIPVRELVSPFRYDVVVRQQFFDMARPFVSSWPAHADDVEVEAWRGPYGRWYRDIAATVIGVDVTDSARLRAGFTRRVHKSMTLFRQFLDVGGFDARYPITVRRYRMERMPSGVCLNDERFVPLDGCHRLALLLAEGRECLQAHEYRIEDGGAPLLDNTAILNEALELPDTEYVSFIASGFLAEAHTSADELVAALAERQATLATDVADMMRLHRHWQDG